MKNMKISLQIKLGLMLIVITTIILAGYGGFNYINNKSKMMKKLEAFAEFSAERLSNTVVKPIWNVDIKNLEDILVFEMNDEDIYKIIVTDSSGESVLHGVVRDTDWNVEKTEKVKTSDRYIKKSKVVTNEDQKIGIVDIYFTTEFTTRELNRQLLYMIFQIIVLNIVLVIAMILALKRIVINPVNNVVALTGTLKKGNLSVRLKARHDEIGVMINAINEFAEMLQTALNSTNRIMKDVASGNLTQHIEESLEGDLLTLKENINTSIDMLSNTISEVVLVSQQVDNGAKEINSSANNLADGTTKQAAALEQISSALNEFSLQTKTNSDNAGYAQELSDQTLRIVQKGNDQMGAMLGSINTIKTTSSEVSKVIKAIDDIAFQTNLLALNAAVEAARAGQYGKGFAVVAEEVRNLASRSAVAAKDTTELIEASIKEVDNGVFKANQTAAVLDEISVSVKKTNDLMNEITRASQEQTKGIGEINAGLSQINEIVQQNSAISEETAASSQELSSQAGYLQKLMNQFDLNKISNAMAEVDMSINKNGGFEQIEGRSMDKMIPKMITGESVSNDGFSDDGFSKS